MLKPKGRNITDQSIIYGFGRNIPDWSVEILRMSRNITDLVDYLLIWVDYLRIHFYLTRFILHKFGTKIQSWVGYIVDYISYPSGNQTSSYYFKVTIYRVQIYLLIIIGQYIRYYSQDSKLVICGSYSQTGAKGDIASCVTVKYFLFFHNKS